MGPKIDACIDFVKKTKKEAIITSIESLKDIVAGKEVGTKIVYKWLFYYFLIK